jgi:hypothetical protein
MGWHQCIHWAQNTSKDSSLKVISGSHRFNCVPQKLGALTDDEVLSAGRACDPHCRLEIVDVREGDFFIFHGRLWYGSHNTGQLVRTAIIAQYSSPDAEVAIPGGWDDPISWHSYRPPCVLVRGTDAVGRNHIVDCTAASMAVTGSSK